MMHLASQRTEVERPSVFDRARRIVKDVLREEPRGYFLWTEGRWMPASLDDIMKRANERLKRMGLPQIATNLRWIV